MNVDEMDRNFSETKSAIKKERTENGKIKIIILIIINRCNTPGVITVLK